MLSAVVATMRQFNAGLGAIGPVLEVSMYFETEIGAGCPAGELST
jgi:hypothetical protein